jgi:hypothetical protein
MGCGGIRGSTYHGHVTGDVAQILIVVAVWTAGSVLLATVWRWLRPRIPGHRLVVVALRGDAIVAAVDESLRDMPLAVALRSYEEIGRRLADALIPLRTHGIVVTAVELLPFTGPDGQVWGASPLQQL